MRVIHYLLSVTGWVWLGVAAGIVGARLWWLNSRKEPPRRGFEVIREHDQ